MAHTAYWFGDSPGEPRAAQSSPREWRSKATSNSVSLGHSRTPKPVRCAKPKHRLRQADWMRTEDALGCQPRRDSACNRPRERVPACPQRSTPTSPCWQLRQTTCKAYERCGCGATRSADFIVDRALGNGCRGSRCDNNPTRTTGHRIAARAVCARPFVLTDYVNWLIIAALL